MSTGLSIVQATYGVGSTTVDVTNTVASLVKDGTLRFTVSPTTLNVSDPSPGSVKTLTTTYTINGGSNNVSTEKDGSTVNIDAPPIVTADGLQITKAEYGYEGNYTDVTDSVQNQVSNGSVNLTVGFKAVGIPDPNPSKQKTLKVSYTLNGKSGSKTIKDGSPFQISAPPREAKSNTTPTKAAGSFIGSIFYSIASFFATFLYTLSVFVGIEYGNQFISSMLWGALCFFIPGFAFWGLPIITFFVRLFSTADFIY